MLSTHFEAFVASLFPLQCQECGKALSQAQNKLCQGCFASLSEHRFSWERSWHPQSIKGLRSIWSALEYKGAVKSLLHRAKFKHEFYLLDALSSQSTPLFDAIVAETKYDAAIPMPIHLLGRWNRRYNQTEIIAGHLCPKNKLLMHPGLLRKRWGFHPQHGLRKEERLWNILGAFKIKNKRAIKGKTFLLIDDIITTGSTASEAASTLMRHGAKHVDLFTLARCEKQNHSFVSGKI